MKRLAGLCMALAVVMLLGSPISAEDKEKKAGAKKAKAEAGEKAQAKKGAKKGQRKRPTLAQTTLKKFAALELTEEQTAKIKELAKEFGPKIMEAQKKFQALIPEDQRKARREAIAKARKEGKKVADVVTAFKPTEEQAAAQKAVREVQQAFNAKVMELFTKEQRQALRKARQNAAGKKPARNKKAGATKAKDKAE